MLLFVILGNSRENQTGTHTALREHGNGIHPIPLLKILLMCKMINRGEVMVYILGIKEGMGRLKSVLLPSYGLTCGNLSRSQNRYKK